MIERAPPRNMHYDWFLRADSAHVRAHAACRRKYLHCDDATRFGAIGLTATVGRCNAQYDIDRATVLGEET
jgi:hypothetical protein